MDSEIKRLLKLEQIKGFNLLESEKKKLAEWKSQQKRIKPVEPKNKIPKGYVKAEIGVGDEPRFVAKQDLETTAKIVKNVVKASDKETGEIEE